MIVQKNKMDTNNNRVVENLDKMTQAKKSFEYIKKMIKGWIDDLNINLEKANDLLRNFHKWITTYSNALYDPLLFKIVNELMKNMFGILINKLSNLGLNIVYANFSKIIVDTGKQSYKEAENTINYILKKCAQENGKLFGYLALRPLENYYQVLLYKDPLNFVGIFVTEEEGRNEILGNRLEIEAENENENEKKI